MMEGISDAEIKAALRDKRVWNPGGYPDMERRLDRWLNTHIRLAIRDYVRKSDLWPDWNNYKKVEFCVADINGARKSISYMQLAKTAISLESSTIGVTASGIPKLREMRDAMQQAINLLDAAIASAESP